MKMNRIFETCLQNRCCYTVAVMKACFLIALALAFVCGCASHTKSKAQGAEAAKAAQSPYREPLSTPGARFGSLPGVVQATVLSEAGTASIYDILQDNSSGRMVYKIFFVDAHNYPPLWVASDGSVLNRDLTVAVPGPREARGTIPMSELPTGVLRVLLDRPAGAEISSISKDYWGDHAIYIVTFKDEVRFPKMYISGDGTLLVQGPN